MRLHDHAPAEPGYEEYTHHGNYVQIWAVLVVLLVVSVAGPFFGHPIVTLVTAFGIALVKAYLVAKNFMHINVAPRYVATVHRRGKGHARQMSGPVGPVLRPGQRAVDAG